MKKFTLILIALALIATCFVTSVAFAETNTPTEERESVHFIAPTAMTVVGSHLFVADNIEDNKTAIICFDATAENPEPVFTYELEMRVSGLSNNGADVIYAFGNSQVTELKIAENAAITVGATYSFAEGISITDFAYGYIPYMATGKTMYALTQDSILQYFENRFQPFASLSNLTNATALLSVGDETNAYLYYIHNNTCDRYKLKTNGGDEEFAAHLQLSGFVPIGMFELGDKVALYSNQVICCLLSPSPRPRDLSTSRRPSSA